MYSTALFEQINIEKAKEKEKKRLTKLNHVKSVLEEYFTQIQVASVYITGSLVQTNKFNDFSDIDIAVSELPEEYYFKCISDLEEKLLHPVEIIELEHCKFEDKIRKTGIKVK